MSAMIVQFLLVAALTLRAHCSSGPYAVDITTYPLGENPCTPGAQTASPGDTNDLKTLGDCIKTSAPADQIKWAADTGGLMIGLFASDNCVGPYREFMVTVDNKDIGIGCEILSELGDNPKVTTFSSVRLMADCNGAACKWSEPWY
ncbi:MAG: hypothetical protein Q9159_000293 [Coniocarpon cinnabarinum]